MVREGYGSPGYFLKARAGNRGGNLRGRRQRLPVLAWRKDQRGAADAPDPVFHAIAIDDAVPLRGHGPGLQRIDHETFQEIAARSFRIMWSAALPEFQDVPSVVAWLDRVDDFFVRMLEAPFGIDEGHGGKDEVLDTFGSGSGDLEGDDGPRVVPRHRKARDFEGVHQFERGRGPAFDRRPFRRQRIGIAKSDQHSGGSDVRLAQETVGIYYGGDFAPASALTGKTTATYSRKAGTHDAGVVRITTGSGLADASPTLYKGDVSLTADFNTARVNGRIDNIDRIAGMGRTNFDVVLEDATISGVHYDNGKVRLVQTGTNTDTATIGNSAFIGSFMGKDAERTAGVFQATGQMDGKQAFVSGRFAADEVK